MIHRFCFTLTLFFSSVTVREYPLMQLIVWNVGQGQWITLISRDNCWHFDFGGERNPIKQVKKLCHWRWNKLLLSHPDRDHYSFIGSIKKNFKLVCLTGPSWSQIDKKKIGAAELPFCANSTAKNHQLYLPRKYSSKDDNSKSQIAYSKKWLIPGDAPQALEKKWMASQPPIKNISLLVLGHHGSKTSTSLKLLSQLTRLRQCVASSRKKKYGHPHKNVRLRIQKHCSLLLTEEWNHIHFIEPGT